jgi:16S rRNA processing protein RimM
VSTTEVVVGRIGRAHGIRGEVSVEPRSDEPDRRFVEGAVLAVEPESAGRPASSGRGTTGAPATRERPLTALTVVSRRWHQGRLLVRFAEAADRTAAEQLRGLVLSVEVDVDERPEDPEEFYDHQLVGLQAVTTGGEPVGEVASVAHTAAQDLLVIVRDDGTEVLVPFVEALVPVVDVAAGRLEVADRPGLLTPLPDED